ncbi:MAG TPA: radical SAM/SPASM domain-containing protein [Streptosporangiaceae bacterium]|jgi:MoaA/NifB/PqqE/SkfB family radical SAM enzyme|nr:radical SAM/SPASM domain-containing protein [Streptosporangiaceae bacterium]
MIRIRFPTAVRPPAELQDRPDDSVEITHDTAVIALESEKNRPEHVDGVNTVLRPIFEQMWHHASPLFRIVSVETRSSCNYTCSFCPVSRSVDPREAGEMSLELLQRIAGELADLRFAGRIALFGNNEPLLDRRLADIVRMFRSSCPKADLRILTNGVLATPDLVGELFEAGLSTLTVNNYTDGRRLIAPVWTLIAAADRLRPFDIRISVRSRTETLTTRAGLAPNKPHPTRTPQGFCALPFTDLHISYTGDVNLCCFDAYGSVSMGKVTDASIVDIWQAPGFAVHRRSLLRGSRAGLSLCQHCDFDGFREPATNVGRKVTRADL